MGKTQLRVSYQRELSAGSKGTTDSYEPVMPVVLTFNQEEKDGETW